MVGSRCDPFFARFDDAALITELAARWVTASADAW
jgi:hypothetical protein